MSEGKKGETSLDVELQVIKGCRNWLGRLRDHDSRLRVLRYLHEALADERPAATEQPNGAQTLEDILSS